MKELLITDIYPDHPFSESTQYSLAKLVIDKLNTFIHLEKVKVGTKNEKV